MSKALILFMFIICSSCASKKEVYKDADVLYTVINTICEKNENKYLSLNTNADNSEVLEIFKENLTDSIFIKHEMSRPRLTHGKTTVNNDNIKLIKDIFTDVNYSHVKAQIGSFKWQKKDFEHIQCSAITLIDSAERKQWYHAKDKLFISKPVYTKNGYALILYAYNNMTCLIVLSKKGEEWQKVYFTVLGIS